MEQHLRRSDGSLFWGSITARAILRPDGSIHSIDGAIEDVTEKKKVGDTFRYLATHDNLTGIPNRAQFDERLAQAIKVAETNDTLVAVLFLDLDNFKTVNDKLGHAQGDRLLQIIAKRLQSCLRKSDVVARLGGDEFGILLEGLSQVEHATPILHKLLAAISEPVEIQGEKYFVTASIGASFFPHDGQIADALINQADQAMYTVKEFGKNNFRLFAKS